MAEISQAGNDEGRPCLLCGSLEEPTVEHIIPQALWKRFGLDPDHDDLARFRTDLCFTHNQATSVLHQRSEMMDLIETGSPITKKTLQHLGDWIVWITLLLSLARGRGGSRCRGESTTAPSPLRHAPRRHSERCPSVRRAG